MKVREHFKNDTLKGKMSRLLLQLFIPVIFIFISIIAMIVTRNVMFASVSGNIAAASGFNQNFKDDVDLQMYLYVSGSSDEIPWDDVALARELAEELLQSTKNENSRKAMKNVIQLCDNMTTYMQRIQETEQYDERMEQLETNIYGITQLIQDNFYVYLYHEAGEMAGMQRRLDYLLAAEIAIVGIMTIWICLVILRRAFKLSGSITGPIMEMNTRVEAIGGGDLTPHTPVKTNDRNLASLSTGIEDMAERLNKQIELNRQEQILLRETELALIQAQINPHFLYNTLDAIVWLIESGKNEQAETMVTSLSFYFRSFLSDGRDIVTIAEETKHVRSYLEIQQVRYRDIMEYEIDIDPSIAKCKLPKLTLQPLVENAIYHGLKPKRGKGNITVTGRSDKGFIILEVKDTGAGMDEDTLTSLLTKIHNEDTTSFGLVSAYKRLKLLYGDDVDFDILSKAGEGTTIDIRFPGKEELEDETIL
ncbi:two-component system, sensor histidine kinase YesM [Oscillospiraceae bacterium]|nr:two-component system, sensor histidine kinase YesM [Oscillospiraceae bacterium]